MVNLMVTEFSILQSVKKDMKHEFMNEYSQLQINNTFRSWLWSSYKTEV